MPPREALPESPSLAPAPETDEERARLLLDAQGRLKHVSKAARRLLGYYTSQRIESSFFNLVHEQHRTRIMWELAEMVGRHRQRAEWLVRIKTGHGPWRWYQIQAYNRLHRSQDRGIRLELAPCGAAQRP